MTRLMTNRFKNYTLIILAVLVVIGGIIIYQDASEDQRQYELFLNHFYHDLDMTIASIESLLDRYDESEGEIDRLDDRLSVINTRLEKAGTRLDSGDLFLDSSIRDAPRFFYHREVYRMGADGELRRDEVDQLQALLDELKTLADGMYSEERGQEDPDLAVDQFNELIRQLTRNDEAG
ncbi:hypothetical protein ABID56_001562 [Alkalibacillus flavidus]|uniref:Uncharacterized protein n=1 Tax=Alkalibacillus flavidus TaxID=546021 RepID=A0ABV2KV50_9BACI